LETLVVSLRITPKCGLLYDKYKRTNFSQGKPEHPQMKTGKTPIFLLLLAFLFAACAPSADMGVPVVAQNGIEIYQPWARSAVLKADMGEGMHGGGAVTGAFMLIKNTTDQDDMLLRATSDAAAEVQIHQTSMSGGVMSMAEVFGIEIPAGGQAELKPGGYHIMLIGLKEELKAGETVTLQLVFQNAGEVVVEAEVRNP
jgi:periplasmic copper chaperone A